MTRVEDSVNEAVKGVLISLTIATLLFVSFAAAWQFFCFPVTCELFDDYEKNGLLPVAITTNRMSDKRTVWIKIDGQWTKEDGDTNRDVEQCLSEKRKAALVKEAFDGLP